MPSHKIEVTTDVPRVNKRAFKQEFLNLFDKFKAVKPQFKALLALGLLLIVGVILLGISGGNDNNGNDSTVAIENLEINSISDLANAKLLLEQIISDQQQAITDLGGYKDVDNQFSDLTGAMNNSFALKEGMISVKEVVYPQDGSRYLFTNVDFLAVFVKIKNTTEQDRYYRPTEFTFMVNNGSNDAEWADGDAFFGNLGAKIKTGESKVVPVLINQDKVSDSLDDIQLVWSPIGGEHTATIAIEVE